MTEMTWNSLLREQLTWHWTSQLRERLTGLTDEEYFWEPAPGCWNVRPRGAPTDAVQVGADAVQVGAGTVAIDFAIPQPEPPPLTTIAWRLGHVIVGVLAMRNASHFGRAPTGYDSFEYAGTASQALAQLDAEYATWTAGVQSLGEAGLLRRCGPAEGPYADQPLAALVLHINRELIHHLAEVCLLRDLYRYTRSSDDSR